jgi:hypothetical protein
VEVVAVGLCHGHAGRVMTEDVNAAIVEATPPKNVGRLICRYIDRQQKYSIFCANLL